jgi:mannosyltransferase
VPAEVLNRPRAQAREPRMTDAPRRFDLRRAPTALWVGVLAAAVSFAGSWVPSYWGDEAASVMSAGRSWRSLAAELTTIDAVHGLYYALLHIWVSAFGESELATRAPSAIAVGLLSAGVVTLVRSFGRNALAVVAGLICIVLPRVTAMGIEARSYALGAAVAVWVTVLLVELMRRRAGRVGWLLYGVAVAAGIYLFLYLALLLIVHLAYLLVIERRVLRQWVVGAAAAILLALPVIALGYMQRSQIRFLARRHYSSPFNVLVKQWFGSVPFAVVAWVLIVAAVVGVVLIARRGKADDRSTVALGVLATAWLVVPTSVLLVGDAALSPMYNVRYLSSSVGAAVVLMALGIGFAVSPLRRRAHRLTGIGLTLAVLAVIAAPGYLHQRTPWAKDGGSDWRQAAAYVGDHADPGDAVVFDQSTKPSRDPRLALRLYPVAFVGLRDVALVTAFDSTDGLWDSVAPLKDVGIAVLASRDIWALELATKDAPPDDIQRLESLGYRVESATLIHRTTVYHLSRKP